MDRLSNEATFARWIACHECDLLHERRPLAKGMSALCSRCGALLYQKRINSLERTLALSLTAAVFFVIANVYPFMSFALEGRVQNATLMDGATGLYQRGFPALAFLVFFASILAPALRIAALLYVLLPLSFGRQPSRLFPAYRLIGAITPWSMLEVYMLGLLVAIVKLSEMATIEPGTAFYAFCLLILTSTAASSTFEPSLLWEEGAEAAL